MQTKSYAHCTPRTTARSGGHVIIIFPGMEWLATGGARLESVALFALFQQVLIQGRDFHNLLALATRNQHGAFLPIVHVQFLLGRTGTATFAELANACQIKPEKGAHHGTK